jgi:hypothetical protein
MWVVSQTFLQALAAWLIESSSSGATAGPLEAVYCGLYISPTPVLNPKSLLAAITEATYTGYARKLITWFPPYVSSAGPVALEGGALHFSPTDAVTPNNITGVFLADALTAGHLLMSIPWPGIGAPLSDPSQALTVDPFFLLPVIPSVYGAPEMTN